MHDGEGYKNPLKPIFSAKSYCNDQILINNVKLSKNAESELIKFDSQPACQITGLQCKEYAKFIYN